MCALVSEDVAREVDRLARPLRDGVDELAAAIADAKVVMLGEATHGTAEFYDWRREITKILIAEHGFGFVAVEGDWPDAAMIDDWVRHAGADATIDEARAVLRRLDRWPTWMWANQEIAELAVWLARYNASRLSAEQARFHGLDVYSLYKSISAVLQYLRSVDSELAAVAARRYECFEAYRPDEILYARAALHMPPGCEEEAIANLVDLNKLRVSNGGRNGARLFDARQNALVVRNADRYYRTMLHGDERSWNVRDEHMIETLDRLLSQGGSSDGVGPKRGIVWAHNTHIGDYLFTDMTDYGYVNLGGMARERYGEDQVALVGFGTFEGSVIASHAWDGPATVMPVPQARPGSYEFELHSAAATEGEDFFMVFDDDARGGPLSERAGHRAIGVVYDPAHEGRSNYVPTSLANRYDAFVFVHETQALHPLAVEFEPHEIPETWPSGV